MDEIPYRVASDEADERRFAQLLVRAFAVPETWAAKWSEWAGRDCVRLLGHGERAPAGLGLLAMGQYFGGARVACTGVAGVAVAPERRGEGLGSRIMKAALEEMSARGMALSCLYPATLGFYRALGYQLAGGRYELRVPCAALDQGRRVGRLIPFDDVADARMRACYARAASRANGWLDRHAYFWVRVREQRGETRDGFGVVLEGDEREFQGYVWIARRPAAGPALARFELGVSDIVAEDAAAGRAILQFLADHRSVAGDVVWHGGPADPLRDLVPEVAWKISLASPWMLRIVDVTAALQQRGYSPFTSGTVHFELQDEILPANQGRFVLEVDAGRARVRRGGDGTVTMHVRDLAALYAGHASAEHLSRFGTSSGPARDRQFLAALFAGPTPAMPDMF